MEFLYPEFNTVTHIVIRTKPLDPKQEITPIEGITEQFPSFKKHESSKDIDIPEGAEVCVVRENIGFECKWSQIKIVDAKLASAEFFNKKIYILSSNLLNVGGKQTFFPICDSYVEGNPNLPDINPTLRQAFIPYADRKNGLYSVRIQVDYERVLDLRQWNKLLEDVYLEGVRVLLGSRGFQSDNDTINKLKSTYYTFAYINKDLDLTIIRDCEPLTFTVSIPLNFFDQSVAPRGIVYATPTNFIRFTNKNFIEKINNVIAAFTSRSGDLNDLLYPNKQFDSFNIDFLIANFTNFSLVANELFAIGTVPLDRDVPQETQYEIALGADYELLNIRAKTVTLENTREVEFAEGLMAMARMRGEFNFKRVLYILANDEVIIQDSRSLNILDFIAKHIKYPAAVLGEEKVAIRGLDVPPEMVKKFRLKFEADKQSCYNLSNLVGDIRDTANLAKEGISAITAIYHLFVPHDAELERLDVQQTFLKKLNKKYNSHDLSTKPEANGVPIFYNPIEGIGGGVSKYWTGLNQEFSTNFSAFGTSMKGTLNSFWFLLGRIRLEEIIFKKIFCYFRKLNPNDPQTAKELANIPYGVFNYINYVISLEGVTGWQWIRALEDGIAFDFKLTCNDSFVYFMKSIRGWIKTGAVLFNQIGKFVSSLEKMKSTISPGDRRNPYAVIVDSVLKAMQRALTDIIFQFISDFLTENCDNAVVDVLSQYGDILNTHNPVVSFTGLMNNNKQIIEKNRERALREAVDELRYGPDIEYTVDLLQLLFADMKCLLSPLELINLLKGRPAPEVIILIKNLIRAKYSKDPNNLSHLLDDIKLTLFFSKLGQTVDNKELEKIEQISRDLFIGTGKEWIDVCTEQNYEIRKNLIENKVPKELGILEDSNKKYLKEAQRLLTKINSPPTPIEISALCPDVEDEEVDKLKDHIIKTYENSIRGLFSEVLTTYTLESKELSKLFRETHKYVRQKSNKEVIDTIEYYSFNQNLELNLRSGYVNFPSGSSADNSSANEDIINYEVITDGSAELFKFKFLPKDRSPLSERDISDSLLNTEFLNATEADPCYKDIALQKRSSYSNLLLSGAIMFEPFQRDWGDIDKKYSERKGFAWTLPGLIGQESFSEAKTTFYKDLKQNQPLLFEYLKSIPGGIFIVISLNMKPYWDTRKILQDSAHKIVFRTLFYDKFLDDFRALYISNYQEKDPAKDLQDMARQKEKNILEFGLDILTYTGGYMFQIYSNDYFYMTIEPTSQDEYMKKYYPKVVYFKNLNTNSLDRPLKTTYVLTKNLIEIVSKKTKDRKFEKRSINIFYPFATEERYKNGTSEIDIPTSYTIPEIVINDIAEQYSKSYDSALNKAKTYSTLINSYTNFKKNGLFNIITNYDKKENQIQKSIFIPTTDKIDNNNAIYVPYLSSSLVIPSASVPDFKVKDYVKIVDKIFTNITYELDKSYFKSFYTEEQTRKQILEQYKIYDLEQKKVVDYEITNDIVLGKYVEFITGAYDEKGNFLTGSEYTGSYMAVAKDITFNLPGNADAFNNEKYKFIPKEDYTEPVMLNNTKVTLYDYKSDIRYQKCNIFPHYLNLDYFINNKLNDTRFKLCDNNLSEAPIEALDDILTNITVRQYVTDILVKVIPILTLLDTSSLLDLHEDQNIVNIIRECMKSDMHTFSSDLYKISDEKDYFNNFVKTVVEKSYKKSLESERINFKYVLDTSTPENAQIDYYIRKEIKRFLNYSLDKRIFKPSAASFSERIRAFASYSTTDVGRPFAGSMIIGNIQKIEDGYLPPKVFNVDGPIISLYVSVYDKRITAKISLVKIPNYGSDFTDGKTITLPYPEYDKEKIIKTQHPLSMNFPKLINFGVVDVEISFGKISLTFTKFSTDTTEIVDEYINGLKMTLGQAYYAKPFFQQLNTTLNLTESQFVLNNLNFVKNEFYTLFLYALMSSTVDIEKRNVFLGTKSALSKLFFRRKDFNDSGEEVEKDYTEKSQQDIVTYILNLAYSPNPAFLGNSSFDYGKYVKFFLMSSYETAKNTFLNMAMVNDPVIQIARNFNFAIATAQMMAWAFVPPEEQRTILLDNAVNNYAGALFYNRINEGKSILPDSVVALTVMPIIKKFPTDVGWAYMAFDIFDYLLWIAQTTEKINQTRKDYFSKEDPCKKKENPELPECNPDSVKKLKDSLNGYEEGA